MYHHPEIFPSIDPYDRSSTWIERGERSAKRRFARACRTNEFHDLQWATWRNDGESRTRAPPKRVRGGHQSVGGLRARGCDKVRHDDPWVIARASSNRPPHEPLDGKQHVRHRHSRVHRKNLRR